jgi:hypothetical protein
MYLIKHHTMKTYGGQEVQLHTLAQYGDEWPVSGAAHITPSAHLTESQMDTTASLDAVEKKTLSPVGIKFQFLSHSFCA